MAMTDYQLDSTHLWLTSLAGFGKLDRITAHSAEGIQDNVTLTTLSDMRGDGLWGDTEPARIVEQKRQRIVQGKVK